MRPAFQPQNDHFSRTRTSMAVGNRLVAALGTPTAAELDALLPSILDKAFKGEL